MNQNVPSRPDVTHARDVRAKRRVDRLSVAINTAATAIRTIDRENPNLVISDRRKFDYQVRRLVNPQRFGISPILIAIIIQLIPILINWLIKDRNGFYAEVADLARDVTYNTYACITPSDVTSRAAELESQFSADLTAERTGQQPTDLVELTRIEKLIAIIAIMRILSKFMDWWNK